MSEEWLRPGEIVHATIHFKLPKGKTLIAKEVVFSRPYKGELQTKYYVEDREDASFLKKYGIETDAEITKVDVLKSLGFKVQNAGFSTAKKNETNMKRKKSGAYD